MKITNETATAHDYKTLSHADFLEIHHKAGIFYRGAGQAAHFRRLVRCGWLTATDDWGHDIDGEVDGEVRLFRLTDAGRGVVKQWDQREYE